MSAGKEEILKNLYSADKGRTDFLASPKVRGDKSPAQNEKVG
jgi:hypothetical protein